MRILIVIAVLLIALVAGGLVAVSRLVVWDDYRDELTARAEAMTGQSVAIQGRIDLNLLPQPTLTLGQTTLASPADAARLEIERLDLELKPLPCCGGRLDVEEVRLIRPVLQVEPATDGRAEAHGAGRRRGVAAARARRTAPPQRDRWPGHLARVAGGRSGHLEQVNLDLSTPGPTPRSCSAAPSRSTTSRCGSMPGSDARTRTGRARYAWSWPPTGSARQTRAR